MTTAVANTIEREVAAALESVLPRAGLRPFVSLTTPEKVAQLCELSNIVIGIRLFNRDIGKGGVGLESFSENEVQKKILLERFQEENPGFDFSGADVNGMVPDPKEFMGGVKYN